MARKAWLICLGAAFAGLAAAQTEAPGEPLRLEIQLDRREGQGWRPVDPGFVFASGDRIRFRVRTTFDGFLYVMIQSTSGKYETLFPRGDTGEDNRLEAGKEFTVPATEGWFRIAGPPGQDVTYWLVSPVRLAEAGAGPPYTPLPPPPPVAPGESPYRLMPRCDSTLLRARGDCIDRSAGLHGVEDIERLPKNIAKAPDLRPRELLFMRQDSNKKPSSVVSAPPATRAPFVYEFRIAHK
jgi:hypothetical protein